MFTRCKDASQLLPIELGTFNAPESKSSYITPTCDPTGPSCVAEIGMAVRVVTRRVDGGRAVESIRRRQLM